MTDAALPHHEPPASRRLAVLRQVDAAVSAALQAVLADLDPTVDQAALADLLAQVAAEDAPAARALADRLPYLGTALADMAALHKWALHGLQHHHGDAPGRLQFFTQHDVTAFADQLTEGDCAHLLAARDGLLHYLAGFGHANLNIALQPPAAVASTPAAALSADLVQFPRRCAGVTSSQRSQHYRATLAHAAAHWRFSPLARLAGNRPPVLLATMGLIEDARVERLMAQAYPGLHALWGQFHTATRASAGVDYAGLTARLAHALHHPGYDDTHFWVNKGRHLFEQAAEADLHDVASFDSLARTLAIDAEKMRLQPHRLYRPQPPYRDDNSLLWNLNAAAPEDEHRTVVREDYELRPDQDPPPNLRQVEVDARVFTRHPEWDHRLEALREDWVTVIEPGRPRREAGTGPAAALPRPRHRLQGLARTPDRAIRLVRLPEGDALDLNAAIDSVIQQRAGIAPDGRVFCRHGRRRRATAIVLLLDLSASTSRYVPGSFTPVLDVEKSAATLVAQSLDATLDRIAVHGFSSNGRHEVHYQRIKDFDEPFAAPQQQRLAALRGSLSTRMGAALRHAGAALQGETADHKVILLLTDGEPSDVDVFDDAHLVEDARHAVASNAARGIRSFCLTLDRQADGYVRRIFGARNYLIADRADAFAGHTGQTLVRLIAH
jgi:hypothetical protein